MSRDYRIDVSVIRSGHPVFVFGTSRRSDHPKGRAFDTWRINGHPVVDPRTSRTLVVEYMHAAASAGSYNVGGPYALSGPGTSSSPTPPTTTMSTPAPELTGPGQGLDPTPDPEQVRRVGALADDDRRVSG